MPEAQILITSGEPAGIGPDIVASLDPADHAARLVVISDRELLRERALALGADIDFVDYPCAALPPNAIEVVHEPLAAACTAGRLEVANAAYVLRLLEHACRACLAGEFDAMVTAPVQKEIINRAGIAFSGHTEYLAGICGIARPVMLLHTGNLRVALVTTHLPLRRVADAITRESIVEVVAIVDQGLRLHFGIARPRIKVCGLNPHAGENGYLGSEEIDTIVPALETLRQQGIDASGPYPADTLFTGRMLADADAIIAMYHDQGLPVLKHVGFHNAVNTTLGLPIIRTSVDHGTALDLAGTGMAQADSLATAIESAIEQAQARRRHVSGARA